MKKEANAKNVVGRDSAHIHHWSINFIRFRFMLFNYKEHRIFAFSDTHGMHNRLHIPEEADILLCAGDVVPGFGKDGIGKFSIEVQKSEGF